MAVREDRQEADLPAARSLPVTAARDIPQEADRQARNRPARDLHRR